tara:strand:+ start:1273 stop:1812 length:540 start_codon:yes stop_codon:yes gene_type:complete
VDILKVHEFKNFLTEEEFSELCNEVYDGEFPWYRGCKTYLEDNHKDKIQHQMFHMFINTFDEEPVKSYCFEILMPFLNKMEKELNVTKFLRAKINLNYNSGEQIIGGWHFDWDDNTQKNKKLHVALFYLNTNNGYTLLDNGTKIPSVANKLVVFGNDRHTDVTHTDTEERLVLNIGFYT